jgi:hypothetical protein
MTDPSETLASAVAGVLEAGGPQVLDQPGRFRSMLADVLGSDAGPLRREQSALVGVVEQGAGADLLAGPVSPESRSALVTKLTSTLQIDDDEVGSALDALEAGIVTSRVRTDLTDTVAPSVVPPSPFPVAPTVLPDATGMPATWSPAAASPPPPPPPPPAPAPPTVAPAAAAPPVVPTALPSSLEPERPAVVVGPDLTGGVAGPPRAELGATSAGSTTDDHRSGRRRLPLLVGIAGLVALVGILATVIVTRSDGPQEPVSQASLQFPTESLAFASFDRNWDVTGDVLTGSLNFRNDGSETAKGRHIEVIPKSLASGPEQIVSDPSPNEIIDPDPILGYDLEIGPGETKTVTYKIPVPPGTDDAKLAAWKEEAATAMAAYQAAMTKVPSLAITAPADGATVDTPDFVLTGTTDPDAIIDINGGPTPVRPDGTWEARQFGYPVGPHVYTVTATGTNKVTATLAITVNYAPPQPPPSVTCWDGSSAPDTASCPEKPAPVKSVKCWNGSTAPDAASCPAKPVQWITCWNGSKAPDAASCPPRPPPDVECWDGSRAPSLAECPKKPDPDPPNFTLYGPTSVYAYTQYTYYISDLASSVVQCRLTTHENRDWIYGTEIYVTFNSTGTYYVWAECWNAAGTTYYARRTVTVY